MDFGRSFSYIFEDSDWITKLAVLAFVSLFGSVLAIILVGLVLVAAVTGWQIQLMRNVRDGVGDPMPGWEGFGDKISLGLPVLGAGIVYSIPAIILVPLVIVPIVAGNTSEETILLTIYCVLLPLMLLYGLIVGFFLGLGTVRYAQRGGFGSFFEFNWMFATISNQTSLVGQWFLFTVIASIALNMLGNVVPCIGTLIAMGLTPPVVGHLSGQFMVALDEKPKPKKRG